MILGLDISTTAVGWCLTKVAESKEIIIVDGGFWKNDNRDIYDNAEESIKRIDDIIDRFKSSINLVVVEDSAKKFTQGKSSADTLFKLFSVNSIICYHISKIRKYKAIRLAPASARKAAWGTTFLSKIEREMTFPDIAKTNQRKHQIYLAAVKKYGERLEEFIVINRRSDKMVKENYDFIDSLTLSRAGWII